MQRAVQAAPATAEAPQEADSAGNIGGVLRGGGGGNSSRPSSVGQSAQSYDLKRQKNVAIRTVRQVADKTFFFRGGKWIDSTLKEGDEKKAKKIERYSDEYFQFAAKHGKKVNRYLAMEEPVVIKIGDTIYSW